MKTTKRKPCGKFLPTLLALLLALPLASLSFLESAHANSMQDQGNENGRVLHMPQGQRRRRVRGDRPRRGRHSIRRSFARAGRSAGRGGKRFGQNIGHGRPVRGGKEFGKGMGGFGKHTGRGIGRTMRRVFKP
ncbi:MAG TPA: hypothetical protein VF779_15945 [Pyrinomonadaceae bacterium]